MIPDRPDGANWELAPIGELLRLSFLAPRSFLRFMHSRTRGPRATDASAIGSRFLNSRGRNPRSTDARTARTGGYIRTDAGSSWPGRMHARTSGSRVNARGRGSWAMRSRTGRSGFFRSGAIGCRFMHPRARNCGRTPALESLMPTSPLAMMVLIIKLLIITLTDAMAAPIGILLFKTLPVMRIAFIPGIPLRRIPGRGSGDIDRRISVIRGPAIFIAEKVIQYSMGKPVTLVKDPWRIRPHPRGR